MGPSVPSGPRFEVESFLRSFARAAETSAFEVFEYGMSGAYPLLAAVRDSDASSVATFYISAGIHGDEPAGPLALLALMRQNWFDPRIRWQILPALNPGGLALGTRETPCGRDANRDYRHGETLEVAAHLAWLTQEGLRYDCAVCLHEDWEAKGFYLYELNNGGSPSPSPLVLQVCSPFTGIDLSPEIDGHPARSGLIRPDPAGSGVRERWPEALYLALRHTGLCLTLETPSSQQLEARVMAHAAALRVLAGQVLEKSASDDYII